MEREQSDLLALRHAKDCFGLAESDRGAVICCPCKSCGCEFWVPKLSLRYEQLPHLKLYRLGAKCTAMELLSSLAWPRKRNGVETSRRKRSRPQLRMSQELERLQKELSNLEMALAFRAPSSPSAALRCHPCYRWQGCAPPVSFISRRPRHTGGLSKAGSFTFPSS